jgi:hypothetical protein
VAVIHGRSAIIATMIRYLAFPALIAVVGIVYLVVSHGEPAGSALLLIFAGAMAVFVGVLLPTANNEGPTAPVDPDFESKPR